jgi:hypothetical protein
MWALPSRPATICAALAGAVFFHYELWEFACATSPLPVERLVRDVVHLVNSIDDLKDSCFVDYGTLLGAVRQGGAISYDHDVDMGCDVRSRATWFSHRVHRFLAERDLVMMMGEPYPGTVSAWREVLIAPLGELSRAGRRKALFERARLASVPPGEGSFKPQLRVEDVGGMSSPRLYVDILFWQHTGNGSAIRLRFPQRKDHHIDSRYILPPLEEASYGVAGLVPIPHNASALLERRYGADWRTPRLHDKPHQCVFADKYGRFNLATLASVLTLAVFFPARCSLAYRGVTGVVKVARSFCFGVSKSLRNR